MKVYTIISRRIRFAIGIALTAWCVTNAIAQQPGALVVLNPLWRVNVGADKMTTPHPSERDAFTYDGVAYYLARDTFSGAVPLYRTYSGYDHMDSTIFNEGYPTYITEGGIGYAWPSQLSGMTQVYRSYNSSTGDHAILSPYETLSGYSPEGFSAYAYPRYGASQSLHTAYLDSSSAIATSGNLTVTINRAAGGAIWSWNLDGYEFVNRHDHGRLFQGAIFSQAWDPQVQGGPTYSAYIATLPRQFNPTEAGSGGPTLEPFFGSPCSSLLVSSNVISTRSIPLDYFPADFNGSPSSANTDDVLPVLYSDVRIGKYVVLNSFSVDDISNPNLPRVTDYTTQYYSPTSLNWEEPGIKAFFNTPSRTTSFYLRGVLSGVYIQYFPVTLTQPASEQYEGTSHVTASSSSQSYYVMRVDPAANRAFGIYVKRGTAGVTQVQTPSFALGYDGGNPWDDSTAILQVYNVGAVPAGWSEMNLYVVCGSTSGVRKALRNIWYQEEMGQSPSNVYPW